VVFRVVLWVGYFLGFGLLLCFLFCSVVCVRECKGNYERGTVMQTEQRQTTVRESNRATLRCKYLGNSGRISVVRYESNTWGKDPNRITVAWDYSLGTSENYREAVRQYVERAEWVGEWITSTITDGAVAVWAGYVEDLQQNGTQV